MTVQAMGYFWVGTSKLDDWTSFAIGQLGLQALLPVVHAEGTHGAAAINRLKPKLADSKTRPVIEL